MIEKLQHIKEKGKAALSSITSDFAEIRLSSSSSTTINLSGDQVDSMTSGETIGGSVRILNNGAWGFVSFNETDSIDSLVKRCLELTASIKSEVKSEIAPANPVTGSFSISQENDFRNISLDEKFNLINSYNTILKSSPLVQTTRALYRDLHSNYIYLNSEGSDISYDKSFCGISLTSIAKDGSIIQPYHDSISGYGGYEIVQGQEERAEKVVKISVDLLKAESVPGGTYNVVTDQQLTGVFIHEAFGHLSEADFVHENEQMKKIMVLGKKFGPENLNVIDDGSIPGLSGYIPFDDEGVIAGKTYLIKNGILSGRLHSRETARKMKEHTTGNCRAMNVMRQPIVRMTNTYIDNGPNTREEIMDGAQNGIYAISNIGGQTNLEMFTFTSAYGYEIKNGKPGKMYKDIVLSGNVFKTMKNIEMIGNDSKMFGGLGGCGKGGQGPLPVSFGGPHMLIKDVLIGGDQ